MISKINKLHNTYNNKKSRPSHPPAIQLAKKAMDGVKFLKNLVNVEKKHFNIFSADADATLQFAQCNGATGSGHLVQDISCLTPQSVSVGGRTGDRIKNVSSFLRFQFQGQSAATGPIVIRVMLFRNEGDPVTITGTIGADTTLLNKLLIPNRWVTVADVATVYDSNSQRNQSYMNNWKLMADKTFKIRPDNFSGQLMISEREFGLKYEGKNQFHTAFSTDSTTLARNQIIMVLLADSGNANGATASTLTAVPVGAVGTGVNVRYDITHYYVDN